MKKLFLFFTLVLAAAAFGDEEKTFPDRGWTPVRICFTKGAVAFPEKADVYGVNLGIPESFNYNGVQKIYGIDFGCISADAEADGVQFALTNWSKGSAGVQLSFANLVKKFTGFQLALANYTRESTAVQVGLFNFAREKSKGVQIGILNFMDEGILPFFPLINFSW